jgi:hypothetical protein
VATEDQIVIAAEVTVASPDFGHLEPMIRAARDELRRAGIEQPPDIVLADAGYWHRMAPDQRRPQPPQALAAHQRPGDRLSGRAHGRTTPAARHIAGRRRLRGNAPRHDFPQRPPRNAALAVWQLRARLLGHRELRAG